MPIRTCSARDGPGLQTPPAVSSSTSGAPLLLAPVRKLATPASIAASIASASCSSETPLPSCRDARCGLTAARHANSVCTELSASAQD
jgi:hypothetical protein